jgi:RNA recognition motif-containing protein
MEVKLFVGNLSFSTKEEDIRNLMAQAGTVAAAELIKDRSTGESKGFAFVTMGSQVEAEKATQMFNGYQLDGREIKVGPARPREDRGGSFGNRGNGGGKGWQSGHSNRGGSRRY